MNLTLIKNAVTSNAARKVLIAQKHSPVLMFGAGVVGVVATAILASKATLRLEEELEEARVRVANVHELRELSSNSEAVVYTDVDFRKDLTAAYIKNVSNIVKLYGPTFIVGTAAIASLTGSHIVLTRRYTGVVAAYAALDKGFREYQQRVIDALGEDRERELRHGYVEREIVSEGKNGHEVETVRRHDPNTRSPYARFFDECSRNFQREPEYNLLFLRCQQNYANDRLRARGHLFLNEVYDSLGIDRTKAGAVVGWTISKDGDNFVDFGIFDGDNLRARDFVNGREGSILLDFNVDGVILDKI